MQRWMKQAGVALDLPPLALPPLLAAAGGPRMLAVSGRRADGTVLDSASTTPDRMREARRITGEEAAAAARDHPHQLVVYLLTITGPDAERRLAALGRSGTAAVAGGAEQVAAAVRYWAALGADKVVLHPDPSPGAAVPDPVDFIRFAAEEVQPLLG